MVISSGNLYVLDGVLEPEMVDADSLRPHPDNPNNGDEEVVSESLEINGMYRQIIVQRSTRYILAGHTTWNSAIGLGAEQVPAVLLDVDDDTALRILAVDNESARRGWMDHSAELRLLEKVKASDGRLLGTGSTEKDLERLRAMDDTPTRFTDHASWPTLTLRIPPVLKNAFYETTEGAVSDHDRLEMLLRLAGWQEEH